VALEAIIHYSTNGVRTSLYFIGTKKEKECRYREMSKSQRPEEDFGS
jgi:hypothetical protein